MAPLLRHERTPTSILPGIVKPKIYRHLASNLPVVIVNQVAYYTRYEKTTNCTSVFCFNTFFLLIAGFCLVFCVFFDLRVLELRVEKKMPKKMRAGPHAAKGPFSRRLPIYLGQFDLRL